MKQVLSQQEIDSLLKAVESGKIDTLDLDDDDQENRVKLYDFKRPVRLAKEYISTLNMVFGEFTKIASNILSTQVRTNITVQLASIEQVSFDEFVHSVPRFTLMGLFHSAPLEGTQIIEVSPQLCLQLVDLLCGSLEIRDSREEITKESFTDIEMAILEDVLNNFVHSFELAWRDVVKIKSEIESTETNPQIMQTMSPNEPVVLVTFTVVVHNIRTFINLCVPYIFFEGMLDKLSLRNWFHSEKETDHSDSGKLEKNLQTAPVNMEVLLGETIMTLENFLQLELGDIIPLDGKTSDPLILTVEKFPRYFVKPGLKGKKMAVEVLQYIGGETDE
ncbi:flagellar motor switch protein FliM [Carnobacterium alterfunditum]|uniref:Flagellar motor switch protein FliM n=1 Tax=Carnobacterium alterfunditum TaxID=28230 RepID=A0A1N6I5G3_9LACT|nr:flagellar motor switch protein FliM [Carnobacterium alterfunditum]SIO27165.1 flagellar motor switch protein FliM [Carnobacterium alterfunditum]